MKLKYEFAAREIMGEYVLIPMGAGALAFSGMIATSETGAMLAEALKEDISREALAERIMAEYEVDADTAYADLDTFLAELNRLGLLEGV